jgi:NAD(P)-dependent dehydrogenase (short-subunit alcohol dehydrogenase family)
MLLEDKVALITGAITGIGRATARLFAANGARTIVADINDAEGKQTVEGIVKNGGEARYLHADVGVMDAVQVMAQEAIKHYGRVDIVHSNAFASFDGYAHEISEAGWDRTLDVSLKATWMIARCLLPRMQEQEGGGVLIITGSVHSIRGYSHATAYQAAKGGLLALTRALAADYAPTIRVNAILPGAIETRTATEEARKRAADMCPLKRIGQPEDIAQAALFLASDMSSYMTGTSIIVDGGLVSTIQQH